ncbi:MAG: hypothetical protein BJ554DRAFT_6476 [Olpidium bornovanus]|uniref:Uncharacterized protein n=1 Tax=Olpidium bornovanus TaxID=278681 RepID=A0A8H8DK59_9FUNG|nr:MAG: hypothetical protein BJ554DRAFT_6476 [Olpidium bornovanus]
MSVFLFKVIEEPVRNDSSTIRRTLDLEQHIGTVTSVLARMPANTPKRVRLTRSEIAITLRLAKKKGHNHQDPPHCHPLAAAHPADLPAGSGTGKTGGPLPVEMLRSSGLRRDAGQEAQAVGPGSEPQPVVHVRQRLGPGGQVRGHPRRPPTRRPRRQRARQVDAGREAEDEVQAPRRPGSRADVPGCAPPG